jgi:lipopolysaccharide transport system permease protein
MAISEKTTLTVSIQSDAVPAVSEAAYHCALLPEQPLIRIRVRRSWTAVEFGELWAHRELLYFMVWRDLKVRYKQTIMGASWVILQPVLMTLVFALFLGRIVRVPAQGLPYILFLYAGLLPWTFFSNAVAGSSHSLIANANMITKVYFPRSLVPMAAVFVRLSDLLIASSILIVLMFYYRQPFTWAFLIAPLLVLQLTLLALGLGMWFAALNVKYRDIGTALPVLLQLWMFASPIIYPSTLLPERWKWLFELNPLTGIIGGFRASLLGLSFNWRTLFLSAVVTLALLVYATFAFSRMEDDFADVV